MTEWDIQPGETAKAFHAFSHYWDIPPADRSIDAAHSVHMQTCKGYQRYTKRASSIWKNWSTKQDWVSRAASHDADLSERRRERRAAELEQAQDRAATLARSALLRLARRIKTMNIDEIPAAIVGRQRYWTVLRA